MLGNLLIFCGPETYNMYGHKMVTNPLLYPAEAILVLAFFMHLGLALRLALSNKQARPDSYAVNAEGEKGTGLIKKTLWHQGIVLAVFVVLHLITFKYGAHYDYVSKTTGETIRDLHRLIVEIFQNPSYVAGYVVCLIILGLHLSHGFSSAFRTLGFNHPKYDDKVRKLGVLYALIVAIGFISQPIYVYFVH